MRRHVYYYTHLDPGYEEVSGLLVGDPSRWLPLPAVSTGKGWHVRLHADGALPGPLASHEAEVLLGPGEEDPGASLLRRIAWQSATADRLLPVLEADLELGALEGHGCRLALRGSYRPPLSVVGEAGDRLFGHRVAEACVRRFVLDVAQRLHAATLPV